MLNNEYVMYTMIYELWKFVRHKPDKYGWPESSLKAAPAADLWEVYWGAVFRERELWGLGDDDLDWFFTSLFRSRYASVIELVAVNNVMDISQVQLSQEELQQSSKTFYTDHVIWQSALNDFPPKFQINLTTSKKSCLGYLSTAVRPATQIPHRFNPEITALGVSEVESKKRLNLK